MPVFVVTTVCMNGILPLLSTCTDKNTLIKVCGFHWYPGSGVVLDCIDS